MDFRIGDDMSREDIHDKQEVAMKVGDHSRFIGHPPRMRATYTDEFKRETVARPQSGEQSATDMAIELGLRRNMLYKWADKIEKQAPDPELGASGRLDNATAPLRAARYQTP